MTWQAPPSPVPDQISPNDALAIWAMLAHGEGSEGERLRASGLSRTSYHRARRKVYGGRWIQDRYVPDPRCLGYLRVAFGLSRPLADRSPEYFAQIANFPGTVVLWALSGLAFGAFFLRDSKEEEILSRLWSGEGRARDVVFVRSEPSPAGVPVYFDGEGLWAHFLQKEGTTRYPRGLIADHGTDPGGPGVAHEMTRMLAGLAGIDAGSGPVYLHRSLGLRRSQRRMVDRGLVTRRVFLGPRALPTLRERDVNRMLFVTGTAASGTPIAGTLPTLASRAGVYPFLLAGGEGKVVLGFMGQAAPPGAAQRPPASFTSHLLPTLQTFLSDINLFQGDTTTLVPLVDHRYDRLANPPG